MRGRNIARRSAPIPALLRRGGRSPAVRGASSLTPPESSVLLLRGSGITEVTGDVATWDSEGSTSLRWSAVTDPQRPALVTVGSLSGAQCLQTGSYLRSEAAFSLVKPYVVYALFRVDTWSANRRILDFAAANYLRYHTGTGQNLAWEQGAVDLVSTSAIANGDIISVVVSVQNTGGTNRLYVDGTQEATGTPNAISPTSTVVGIGARGGGVNPSDTSFLELGVWSFADNTESDAFDIAALLAYAAQQRAAAGGA